MIDLLQALVGRRHGVTIGLDDAVGMIRLRLGAVKGSQLRSGRNVREPED